METRERRYSKKLFAAAFTANGITSNHETAFFGVFPCVASKNDARGQGDLHQRHKRRPRHESHSSNRLIMPHGDFSDVSALYCLVIGAASIRSPELWFTAYGPLKPMFDIEPDSTPPPAARFAVQFAGGLLLLLAPTLYVVRWNKLNGKAAAFGFLMATLNSIAIALNMDYDVKGDVYTFVPRGWYVLAALFVSTAFHLAFNANPMLTSAMLLEEEKARAEEKLAKKKAEAEKKA